MTSTPRNPALLYHDPECRQLLRTHGDAVPICILRACHPGVGASGAWAYSAASVCADPDPSYASSASACSGLTSTHYPSDRFQLPSFDHNRSTPDWLHNSEVQFMVICCKTKYQESNKFLTTNILEPVHTHNHYNPMFVQLLQHEQENFQFLVRCCFSRHFVRNVLKQLSEIKDY